MVCCLWIYIEKAFGVDYLKRETTKYAAAGSTGAFGAHSRGCLKNKNKK